MITRLFFCLGNYVYGQRWLRSIRCEAVYECVKQSGVSDDFVLELVKRPDTLREKVLQNQSI